MSKGAKKVLGAIIIIILILAVVWLGYEGTRTETTSINETNEISNENMGMVNEVNEIDEEEENNTVVEEEPADDNTDTTIEEEKTDVDQNSSSETVSGTSESREERAIELAKEYYEEEYGSAEEINFGIEDIYGDGSYIVRVGNAGESMNMFLLVNLDTETVTER